MGALPFTMLSDELPSQEMFENVYELPKILRLPRYRSMESDKARRNEENREDYDIAGDIPLGHGNDQDYYICKNHL